MCEAPVKDFLNVLNHLFMIMYQVIEQRLICNSACFLKTDFQWGI